jgi:hypothetical protein
LSAKLLDMDINLEKLYSFKPTPLPSRDWNLDWQMLMFSEENANARVMSK